MQNHSDFSKAFFYKMRVICERQIVNATEKIMTNEQQRIAHREKLLDDAAGAMSVLRKENERQAAQISALVAENVALKQSELEFDRMCAADYGPDWVSELTETPATDAAIAAIRAEGVEMLRDSIRELERGTEDTLDLYHYCSDFAHQLRESKGAQK